MFKAITETFRSSKEYGLLPTYFWNPFNYRAFRSFPKYSRQFYVLSIESSGVLYIVFLLSLRVFAKLEHQPVY